MNLDNVTAVMRPRGEWEAADLGVRMMRRDARAIYTVWFALTLPMLGIALALMLFTPVGGFGALLYWWLEPVVDGPILRILSRRLFGEAADVRATLRQTHRIAWRNRLFWLTPYRLHFARSIAMPLTQLEGLGGKRRKNRARVMNSRIQNHGIGLTVAFHHLALAIYFGIAITVYALIPASYQDQLSDAWFEWFMFTDSQWSNVISLLLVYVAQTALQPWFVGAGFGLYINCRTQLEAWDIEVAFRRMVQQRASVQTSLVALLALVFVFAAGPDSAQAQTAFDSDWSDETVEEALDSVYDHEALERSRQVEEWKRLDRFEPDEPAADSNSDWSNPFDGFFSGFTELLALMIEFSLWIAVGALLLLLFLSRDRWLPYLGWSVPERKRQRSVIIADGEITAESLPDDVPATARALWQSGDKRGALALLYRSSVFTLVARDGVPLPDHATEGVCLAAVNQHSPNPISEYFSQLTSAWIHTAYAAREPSDVAFEPLCERWRQVFGATA